MGNGAKLCEPTGDGQNSGITSVGSLIAHGASVGSGVIGCHGIDHQDATPLADAGRYDASLKRRHITVERPGEVQRRVALQGHTLGLSGIPSVQCRISKIERRNFRSDFK